MVSNDSKKIIQLEEMAIELRQLAILTVGVREELSKTLASGKLVKKPTLLAFFEERLISIADGIDSYVESVIIESSEDKKSKGIPL